MILSKILSLNLNISIKQAKKLIKNNKIYINNKICNEDININNETIIYNHKVLDNHPLKYYMIHKPKGYVCANKDDKYPCLIDLLPYKDLHYIGRLDIDTTGLVLLTNDLKLRKRLLLPEYNICKVYKYTSLYPINDNDILKVKNGIIIYKDIKCKSAILDNETITLTEGKYHEVKKIFLSLNNKITSLKRIEFGKIKLDIDVYNYRQLTEKEIGILKKQVYEEDKYV